MMDPAVPRSIVKLQYAAARLPFTLLDEYVVTRYCGQDAPIRVGFEHCLGSLDLLAGRLLADDEISRRGEALLRQTRDPAQAGGHAVDASAPPAHSGHVAPDLPAAGQAPEILPAGQAPEALPAGQAPEALPGGQAAELRGQIAASGDQQDSQQVRQAADEQVTTGDAAPAADQAQTGDGAAAAGLPGTPDTPTFRTARVDVTFTLPAEVQAGTVALCGEFNDWSAGDTQLERGSDGSWQATIALETGRSYRYRYLLDGQRWENDGQADRQVPNALGSIDSVVDVG